MNKEKKTIGSMIGNIIFVVIIALILIKLYSIYQKYCFNDFIKATTQANITKFVKDDKIKFLNQSSYKIESCDFNDAVFYKEISVTPNTPYKVSCMVKTENVQAEDEISASGAQICIIDSSESSESYIGTNDWKSLDFIFNSKNRTSVKIGFRLGGNKEDAKGIAWFSDFKLEEGIATTDINWNVACFIFKNVDVNIENKEVKLSMSSQDIQTMKSNMERFKNSCEQLSGNQMTVTYDVYEIDDPITSVSYSNEYGYYVDTTNIKSILDKYLTKEEYDHIFVTVRLGNDNENIEIPVNDWIGLGSMDYFGIGYSNIRLPNNTSNYIYIYDTRVNIFPEEVFVHEFLHSLERTLQEYDYNIPALHDYNKYGYTEQRLIGLKDWYEVYMKKEIKTSTGEKVGLDKIVYKLKPVHQSAFKYSSEIEFINEPQNIIEEIREIFKSIKNTFTVQQKV